MLRSEDKYLRSFLWCAKYGSQRPFWQLFHRYADDCHIYTRRLAPWKYCPILLCKVELPMALLPFACHCQTQRITSCNQPICFLNL